MSVTSDNDQDHVDLAVYIKGQELKARRIESAIANGKKRNLEKRTLGFYESKVDELTKLWKAFEDGDMKIQEFVFNADSSEDCPYLLGDMYSDIQGKYQDYMADLLDGWKEKTPNTPTKPPQAQINEDRPQALIYQQIPLPSINLPSFDGDYNKWRSFHDYFVSVIHDNETLQPVQKLHYLKGCLTGEAERLLSQVPITNEDYNPAWDKLKMRYDNKRLLINTQLKKLFNQPKLHNENMKGLRMLLDTTDECMQQLKTFKVKVEQWDTLLIHIMIQRLPISTIQLWEEKLGDSQELPKFTNFIDFLQTRARVLESISNTISAKVVCSEQATNSYISAKNQSSSNCPICSENHYVGSCKTFLNYNVSQRLDCITKSKRCFNCLSSYHTTNKCTNQKTCKQCFKRHHTLLHKSSNENNKHQDEISEGSKNDSSDDIGNESSEQVFFNQMKQPIILPTIIGTVKNKNQEDITVRCLIDPGAETSLMTQELFDCLELQGSAKKINIIGLNKNKTACSNCIVKVNLSSCQGLKNTIQVETLVIDKITDVVPSMQIQRSAEWTHLQGLNLADPEYYQPGPVNMLLGVDVFAKIVQSEILKGTEKAPIAMNSLFGWIVLGKASSQQQLKIDSNVKAIKEQKTKAILASKEPNGNSIGSNQLQSFHIKSQQPDEDVNKNQRQEINERESNDMKQHLNINQVCASANVSTQKLKKELKKLMLANKHHQLLQMLERFYNEKPLDLK